MFPQKTDLLTKCGGSLLVLVGLTSLLLRVLFLTPPTAASLACTGEGRAGTLPGNRGRGVTFREMDPTSREIYNRRTITPANVPGDELVLRVPVC